MGRRRCHDQKDERDSNEPDADHPAASQIDALRQRLAILERSGGSQIQDCPRAELNLELHLSRNLLDGFHTVAEPPNADGRRVEARRLVRFFHVQQRFTGHLLGHAAAAARPRDERAQEGHVPQMLAPTSVASRLLPTGGLFVLPERAVVSRFRHALPALPSVVAWH